MVMGLVYNTGSAALTHPVFIHSAAFVAQARGGAANFSFALTPHSPLKYRDAPPPTFASEWRPQDFSWEKHGRAYDHFLVRGVHPSRIFGSRLGTELTIADQQGSFFLVTKVR